MHTHPAHTPPPLHLPAAPHARPPPPGTVDALLCSRDGVTNVTRMLSEASRVLAPGGTFLLVSLGDPSRRLCLLCAEMYDWSVQVVLLPKITPGNQAEVDGRCARGLGGIGRAVSGCARRGNGGREWQLGSRGRPPAGRAPALQRAARSAWPPEGPPLVPS